VWPRAKHGQTLSAKRITPVTVLSSLSRFDLLALFFTSRSPLATLAMAAVEVQEIRASSYVGFDSITQQIEHKLLKRGFQFNVIVVGQSCTTFSPSKPAAIRGREKYHI
jgi:hypothetical protein